MSQPISVLLCTRNRPAKLHRAIESILGNSYRDFELVVVDQSTDGESRTRVESFRDPRLVYVSTTTVGLSRARNLAIQVARWDVVVFTDDDCICHPNWLSSIIAEYERGAAPAFEAYALDLEHKHVPEIERYARLARRPIFAPSVGNFAQGMLVCVPLFLDDLPLKPKGADLEAALAAHYAGSAFVKVMPAEASGKIEPRSLNGTNDLELRVFANASRGQAILVAKLDNLGKGASGAAVQNLRLMLHHDETRT
jgi:glycosyltransferase involved in cell wall biosynthesis